MPWNPQRVKVTRWCEDVNDRRDCAELILSNEQEIAEAISSEPWTSRDCFSEELADAFVECVKECGGSAKKIAC